MPTSRCARLHPHCPAAPGPFARAREQSRAEYSTIVNHYFGRRWYVAAQVGLNGALQSLNLISVIQSAQVMDNLISAIFGHSYALNLTPFANVWNATGSGDSPVSHPPSAPPLERIPGSADFFSAFDTNGARAKQTRTPPRTHLGPQLTARALLRRGHLGAQQLGLSSRHSRVEAAACWPAESTLRAA